MPSRLPITLLALLAACAPPPGDTGDPPEDAPALDRDGDGSGADVDCDDRDANIHPGATEVCNGVDDDCDGFVDGEDPSLEGFIWFTDRDLDGHGDADDIRGTCTDGEGRSETRDDCDDRDAAVHPGATEVCNGVDDDCDGATDDADPDVDLSGGSTWYPDADGDGWGTDGPTTVACDRPAGMTATAGDCHDDDPRAYPASREAEIPGDGTDQDCDGRDACRDLDCDGLPDLVLPGSRTGAAGADDPVQLPVELPPEDTGGSIEPPVPGRDAPTRVYFGGPGGPRPSRFVDLECAGAVAVRASDLDLDGYPDLVLACSGTDTSRATDSRIWWNGPDGFSADAVTPLPTLGAADVEVADLDGDGFPDIVFAEEASDTSWEETSRIWWGAPGRGFDPDATTALPTSGPRDVAVADLDADGDLDLVFAERRDDAGFAVSSTIWWNQGGTFGGGHTALAAPGAVQVVVADLDLDGWLDLVFPAFEDDLGVADQTTIWWNGAAGFGDRLPSFLVTRGAQAAAVADVDANGWPDVVVAQETDGATWDLGCPIFYGFDYGIRNTGGYLLETSGAAALGVLDAEADGDLDIVVAGYRDDTTWEAGSMAWLNAGTTLPAFNPLALGSSGARSLAVGDLDGDGLPDLVLGGYRSDASYDVDSRVYLNTGDGWDPEAPILLPGAGVRGTPLVVGER